MHLFRVSADRPTDATAGTAVLGKPLSDTDLEALLRSLETNEAPESVEDEPDQATRSPQRVRGAAIFRPRAAWIIGLAVTLIPATWWTARNFRAAPRIAPSSASLQDTQQESSMKFRPTVAAATAILAASAANADTLLVPKQYATIQLAIDSAANGDVIHVSPGTYHEQVNLSGKAIELVGDAGGAQATIDGQGVRVCIIGNGEPSTCVVRGFVISNGSFVGSVGGGGVSLINSAATFRACRFVGNTAVGDALWSGGAFHSLGGNETIEDCAFVANRGWNQSSASAIYHYLSGSLTVRRCLFDANKGNYLGQAGGARGTTVKVHSEFAGATAIIEDCTFIATESGSTAEYPPNDPDGEVYAFSSATNIQVMNSTFVLGPADRPCALGANLGATITAIGCVGCGYDRTANGNVLVIDSEMSMPCGDCDGDSVNDLEQIIRDPSQDSNGDGVPDVCQGPTCADAELNRDGAVNGADLGILLSEWGAVTPVTSSDLNRDGVVDGSDLGVLLSFWGPCAP